VLRAKLAGGPRSRVQRDLSAYVRVSRLDREDRKKDRAAGDKLRALSPTTQIEQCKVLPALRDMRIEVFEDLHRSGKNSRRPGLDRLRERIQEPDVAIVAVWSITRLGRSVPDLYMLLDEFQKAGVDFVSAKESIDTTTPYGRGFVGILAVLAQMERELTSQRPSANLEQMAHDGGLVGPLLPGLMRDEARNIVIDAEPASRIRRLIDEYATRTHSFRSLAMWANEQGIAPVAQSRGKVGRQPHQLTHWTVDSVRDVIGNMRYAGRFIHKRRANPDGEIVVGTWPGVVAWDVWQLCAEIRKGNSTRRLIRVDRHVKSYGLSGLLTCGRCGDNFRSKAYASHGKPKRCYLCRRRDAAGLCDEPRADADELEGDILAWLKAIRVEPADEATFRRDVASLRIEAESLAMTPPRPERHSATLTTLVDRWDEMSAEQRQSLLKSLFDSLTVRDGRIDSAKPKADWLPILEQQLRTCPTEGLVGIEPTTPALGRRRSIR
jgi:site-specific DNA recombinase